MKLSYIISIVIGVICFCLLYLVLDLNILFSLIISIIAYLAFTLILNKNEDNILETAVNSELIKYEKIYSEAKTIIRKIDLLENQIDNLDMQANIRIICDTSNKILVSLKESPKKTKQVRKFIEYYLPFTLNILNQYNTIEDQKLTSKESIDFMKRVEKMLDRVKEACEIQLNNMYESDLLNTNADIKVFETMLKSDGLVDDNMNIIKVEEEEVK